MAHLSVGPFLHCTFVLLCTVCARASYSRIIITHCQRERGRAYSETTAVVTFALSPLIYSLFSLSFFSLSPSDQLTSCHITSHCGLFVNANFRLSLLSCVLSLSLSLYLQLPLVKSVCVFVSLTHTHTLTSVFMWNRFTVVSVCVSVFAWSACVCVWVCSSSSPVEASQPTTKQLSVEGERKTMHLSLQVTCLVLLSFKMNQLFFWALTISCCCCC